MNVGPTARGVFDDRALAALQTYGDWIKWNARSIYCCSQAAFSAPTDVRYTQNHQTNRLYAHLFAYPFKHLHLPGLAGKVEYAQFLHDASEIQIAPPHQPGNNMSPQTTEDTLTLLLPVLKPSVGVPVIELFLK